ncbi:pimeloyl-ACP methyl ester carboxylesterase [Hymenobacter luteus]|uniref:Pimeloyl-ACP methyl ester carboxylesterase n=2 Tax=Hymenobacter TaxID=89966 RepID=A0A7W9T168_9BACT|nr:MULTISPECIES: alpha/beta hydrolase [Hymenobacter]MBB4601005.1 pimeloyl-ACP methyl ester carboxylesterase [Hymenobacter latericoloratus]MBB6058788.1 pimeloyl-ACP methyl ester carboxylesterase [Hymenobacter luteus]
MNLTAILRPVCSAFLLAATLLAAPHAAQAATLPTPSAADNPASHPNFTVRVVGKGQPMLLIPGLTCPGAVWDETVAHYQKQYQCHIISLAGFGGTPAPASTNQLLRNVRDQLLAYIKTQKLQKPTIIGHSLGGFLALWLSSTQPEAAGPLVIVDSLPFLAAVQNPTLTAEAAKPMAEGIRQQMSSGKMTVAAARQMSATMMTDTARISQATRWSVASDPATVAQAYYDLMTTDLRPEVARIQQPVLVLGAWAAYKQYGSTKESTKAIFDQQYAKLPQHQVVMSEAGRHFLMWDDTQWFFSQTDAFLKQNPVARK